MQGQHWPHMPVSSARHRILGYDVPLHLVCNGLYIDTDDSSVRAAGVHAVQPTTALALGALGVLVYNAMHRAWQERKVRAGLLQPLQPRQVLPSPALSAWQGLWLFQTL